MKINWTPIVILGGLAVAGYLLLKKAGDWFGGLLPDITLPNIDLGEWNLPTVSGGSIPEQIGNLWRMGTGQTGYVYDYDRNIIIEWKGTPAPSSEDYWNIRAPTAEKEGSYG